ncbi:hypothetical protein V8E53_008093 [Lactarius tabidus]
MPPKSTRSQAQPGCVPSTSHPDLSQQAVQPTPHTSQLAGASIPAPAAVPSLCSAPREQGSTMSQGKVRFNQIPDRVVQDKRVPDTPNEDDIERITVSDSSSDPEDVDVNVPDDASLPESHGISAAGGEPSRHVQLLAHRPSWAGGAPHVPVNLEDRLREAQELVDQELNDLERLRANLNRYNDILLNHMLILRNVRNNYLRW